MNRVVKGNEATVEFVSKIVKEDVENKVYLNPDSLTRIQAVIEPSLGAASFHSRYQFLQHG